jgi:predicted ATPase/DNA-binding CsgD family transcriptional regulator
MSERPRDMTSFIGRRTELIAVGDRMAASRLVTLVGPGGVGKTRLALRAAEQHRRALSDGVWVADLASVSRPERVVGTVLLALGVRDQSARGAEEQLLDHLADRHLLLMLDNCEHLREEAARVTHAMLNAAPRLRILTTSREALGVAGEHLLTVPPLAVPDAERVPTTVELGRYDAVALLVDRVRAVRPGFAVTDQNRVHVAQLCASLDGIPLAIELAASRMRSLSIAQVVERLGDRFRLLAGGPQAAAPRQQTLRALIDWSHDLCTDDERLLWARLSVFPGSFDLSAAESICAGGRLQDEGVMDVLDHMVAKSIVTVDQHDESVRFRLLSTMREYGAARLSDPERTALERRHRDYYLTRACAVSAGWCGPGQADALNELGMEYPNLRAALEWSTDRPEEARQAARLVAALRYQWIVGHFLSAGRRWLDLVLDGAQGDWPERGDALWVAAWVSLMQGDRVQAARRLDEAAALADRLGSSALRAQIAGWRGLGALFAGELNDAIVLYESAIGVLAGNDVHGTELTLTFQLVVAQAYAGRLDEAEATCTQLLERTERLGERWNRAYGLWATAIIAWRRDDLQTAETAARSALGIERDFEDAIASALMIELLGWVNGASGRQGRAALLMGAAEGIWRDIGTDIDAFAPQMAADSAACRRTARSLLGASGYSAAHAKGLAMGIRGAIATALDDSTPQTEAGERSPLSSRERQVAALIAEGRRNREVAEVLVLSVRTIDSHVERIMAKLGVHSRAQIAVWVAQQAGPPTEIG